MDDREVVEYTRWIKSVTTRRQLARADRMLVQEVHEIDDSAPSGAFKCHYMRKGGEIVLDFLKNQVTTDQLDKLREQVEPADYNADRQVKEDLFEEGTTNG